MKATLHRRKFTALGVTLGAVLAFGLPVPSVDLRGAHPDDAQKALTVNVGCIKVATGCP